MDTLKEIEDLLVQVEDVVDDADGFRFVFDHLKIAEEHVENSFGKKEYLLLDAQYRVNQAFEGALKEIYWILGGDRSKQKTVFQIEKYLKKEKQVSTKVLNLVTRFREDWRNASTHDHTLQMTKGESRLAILSVTSFLLLLLELIVVIKSQEKELEKEKNNTFAQEVKGKRLSLNKVVVLAVENFFDSYKAEIKSWESMRMTESQFLGHLSGFLMNNLPKKYKILLEPRVSIKGRSHLFPDLVVETENDKIVVEVKRSTSKRNLVLAMNQVHSYMHALGTSNGLIVFADSEGSFEDYSFQKQSELKVTVFKKNDS